MRLAKALLALLLVQATAFSFAEVGSIRLTAFPQMVVADARSTITITAEVRGGSGRPAPNGTRVIFQTTLGHFQESAVPATDGYAHANLVAGGAPGTAKITASAISLSATETTEVEMVANRSELSTANTYLVVEGPNSVQYSMDDQVVSASGPDHGVRMRLGKTTLLADDLQLNVTTQEVRARRAKVTVKGHSYEFQDFLYRVPDRSGFGTTTYESYGLAGLVRAGRWIGVAPKIQHHFGIVRLLPSGDVSPLEATDAKPKFDFADISGASSVVVARRAVVFPNREIQFQKAVVSVNGTRLMSLAFYKVNLTGGASSLGDQILTLNDSKIGVNYPYYLSLQPGQTSLFRFVTGQPSGRNLGGNSASLLNYEMTWNKGDGSEGGLNVTGINQPEWSLDAHHSLHFEDGSSLTALVSSPARRSIFGSLGYSKPLKGFQLSLNSNSSRSLQGPRFATDQVTAVVESDPHRIKSTPLTLYYGLTSTDARSRFGTVSQRTQNTGLRLRGQFDSMNLDRSTSLNASFSLGQQWGTNEGLALYSTVGIARAFRNGSLNLNYDYSGDTSLASAIAGGKQRLSLEGGFDQGKTSLHVYASRSLDANWFSCYGDLSYQMSGLYRLSAGYTLDQYLGDRSLDYDFMLSYKIGIRELGLVWSRKTNRIGFEVLGARF